MRSPSPRYVAAVRYNGTGPWRRVYVRKGARFGFTFRKALSKRGVFTGPETVRIREWAKSKGHAYRITRLNPYPMLRLDTDTAWPNHDLARLLNELALRLALVLFIREGLRTRAQQQAFWDAFVARGYRPPLVARPGTSNHETGDAADVGDLRGRNIGSIPRARSLMRAYGLCLPVPGEAWHVEKGSTWRT